MEVNSNLNIVFANNQIGLNELCLINSSGDFVGVETGKIYPKSEYYKSPLVKARVVCIDINQDNGIIHLAPKSDPHIKKLNYIGCVMTFREAHYYGEYKIFQSVETLEYFS